MRKASIANKAFYRNKRIFVTGHTGFKGTWLTAILYKLGAETRGYALAPEEGCLFGKIKGREMTDNITGDVRDKEHLQSALCSFGPEIVIHLAARATVQECYDHPHDAYETNVMGTVNLLEAVRACGRVKSVVVVTTDKVYANKGDGAVYKENDPLGGSDPYSSSKTCMEYISEAYKRSYLQTRDRMAGVATVRASNILAGGDHIQSRLIPSILNAIAAGRPVELRNPQQTRPWQSMLDALNGYLSVGRLLYAKPEEYSSQWNIGPTRDGIREVLWVVRKMQDFYKMEAGYRFGEAVSQVVESKTLGLDITTSLTKLDWEPELSFDDMIREIVEFFQGQLAGRDERELCLEQIERFYQIE